MSIDVRPPNHADVAAVVEELDRAWETRRPIAPLGERGLVSTAEQAYAVQTSWTDARLARGDRLLGRKIGLTSAAMQQQMGVTEPDYGSLWAQRYFPSTNGRATIDSTQFLQPLLEAEIAFRLGRDLEGPDITPQHVIAATDAVAVSVEIVDSRIDKWRIQLVDTIADNASYGGFTVGAWTTEALHGDLRTIGILVRRGREHVVQGIGAAAMGHPARAVAWLANRLSAFGVRLAAGDIVLSGSLGPAVPFAAGEHYVIELSGHPPLSVSIE
jgi:2-keto-4-pentenoate hydratase